MRPIYLFSIITVIIYTSCQTTELQNVMQLAGSNKGELQQVLEYYSQNPEDSLKYRAAVFLIENMQYHYGIEQTLYCEGEICDSIDWHIHGLINIFTQKHLNMFGNTIDSLYTKKLAELYRREIEKRTK